MTDRNETVLPETDHAGLRERVARAIKQFEGDPEGAAEEIETAIIKGLTREAYYKGRDYGKRAERDKRERLLGPMLERAKYWKAFAETVESELMTLRGKKGWNDPNRDRSKQSKDTRCGFQYVTTGNPWCGGDKSDPKHNPHDPSFEHDFVGTEQALCRHENGTGKEQCCQDCGLAQSRWK